MEEKIIQQVVDSLNKERRSSWNPFKRLGLRSFIKDFIRATRELELRVYEPATKRTLERIEATMLIREKVKKG